MKTRIAVMGLGVIMLGLIVISEADVRLTERINRDEPAREPESNISAVPIAHQTVETISAVAEEVIEAVPTAEAIKEVITSAVTSHTPTMTAEAPKPIGEKQYIEIVDGCGPYHDGACLNMRAEPSTSSPSVGKLRNGMVLRTADTVEQGGMTWHKVIFDEWIRYPSRVSGERYVAAPYVSTFTDSGPVEYDASTTPPTTKRIVIERGAQKLTAYDGDELFMDVTISTGLALTPTPRGTFKVFRKTPSRYMQGPVPGISDDVFDLPGVPWNLYFTEEGGAIHGTYWHDNFGQQWSHGCVNLPPDKARDLYSWADLGTAVIVKD